MRTILGIAVCMLWALFAGAAGAQQRGPAQGNELPERDILNAGTVTVIRARPSSLVRIPTSVIWRSARLTLSGAVPPP